MSLSRLRASCLPQMAYDCIAGGSDDEWTLGENSAAFRRLQLIPRMLIDVTARWLAHGRALVFR